MIWKIRKAFLMWSTESRKTRSGCVSRLNSADELGSFDDFSYFSVIESSDVLFTVGSI